MAYPEESKSTRLLAFYLNSLPWMPAAAATLFIKWKLIGGGERLDESLVFLAVREAGRTDVGGFPALGRAIDQLSFYRADLLWSLWIVPAILTMAALILPRRLRAWFVAAVSAAAIAVLYFERQAALGAGSFVSWRALLDGAAWGTAHAGEILEYLQPGGLVRAGLLLAMVAALACLSGPLSSRLGNAPVRWATVAALALCAFVTSISWLPQGSTIWAHTGVHEHLVSAIFEIESPPPDVPKGDPAELADAYSALANAPREAAVSEFDGKARGYNLILVILETAPTTILDVSGPLDRMPNLRRLREHAWVGLNHHTTHPRSDRALFSILTSFYSADLARVFGHQKSFPTGLLNGLRPRGYQTALYLPNGAIFDFESSMWRTLGFDHIVEPVPFVRERGNWLADWAQRDRLDGEALKRMLDDIRQWAAGRTPFAAVFYPQLGHAPWLDISGGGAQHSVRQRGDEIVIHQDRRLGEIISALEEIGAMDHTLIIVTGDHGIRTRFEDPAFPVGKVDSYAFHVPFLLYAPAIAGKTEPVTRLTSHIDINPTISALYGLEPSPNGSQGSPIWDQRIEDRTTFFWSRDFHGAAGFHKRGQFAMWNSLYDRVYTNSTLSFDAADAVPNGSDSYSSTVSAIRSMEEINLRWVESLADAAR